MVSKTTNEAVEHAAPARERATEAAPRLPDAEQIAASLDTADATTVLRYGVSAQVRISDFAEQVLTHVRAKNVGQVRQHLAELLSKVKTLDFQRVAKPSPLDRIPVLRHLRFSQSALTSHYEKIHAQLDKLVPELNASCAQLLKDVGFFDTLYARNLEHLRDLDAFIAAGDRKLEEWTQDCDSRAAQSNSAETDARDVEDVRDRRQQLECFRKRMQHLRMARMISLQLAPQIRLIQDDLKVLVEETQNTVLTTIPLWKNQIVVAVAMMRQHETSRLAKDATEATTAMLATNSDLIRSSKALIADRESAKSAVERDTLDKLDKANSDFVAPVPTPVAAAPASASTADASAPVGGPRARAKGNGHGIPPKAPRGPRRSLTKPRSAETSL